MAGCLPGKALLHQRQLSLFSMICHLPDNSPHARARHVLTCLPPGSSCLLYGLPHPLDLLQTPLTKYTFKKLTKSLIVDYWEKKLRQEASPLDSLMHFKAHFHSLSSPHPILWTAEPNPYEVSKAIVQSRMLSGRYLTELLASHWSKNPNGYCLNSTCNSTEETLGQILLCCPSYQPVRERLSRLLLSFSSTSLLKLFWPGPRKTFSNSYLIHQFTLKLSPWFSNLEMSLSRLFSTLQDLGASQSTKKEQSYLTGGPEISRSSLFHAVGIRGA